MSDNSKDYEGLRPGFVTPAQAGSGRVRAEQVDTDLRAALAAVIDQCVDVHENWHDDGVLVFRDYLMHRLGTYSHAYLLRDYTEVYRENERLRAALETAQGEAYLGALAEERPTPLDACHNVMRVCLEALGPRPSDSGSLANNEPEDAKHQ